MNSLAIYKKNKSVTAIDLNKILNTTTLKLIKQ
jgi:hypothetical protein